MQIQKRFNKLHYIVPVALVVVLVSGATAYLLVSNQSDTQEKKSETTSKQEADAGKQSKDETVNSGDSSSDQSTVDKGSNGNNTDTNQSGEVIPMSITASTQNGSVFQIRTLIQGLAPNGTCTLQLSKGSATVTKTAGVSLFAQTSTCQGFDIPLSELTPGKWSVKASFEGDSKSGETTSEIEVK